LIGIIERFLGYSFMKNPIVEYYMSLQGISIANKLAFDLLMRFLNRVVALACKDRDLGFSLVFYE